eukprot:TRINITY_DN1090_c0_g1_i3.p1 TRINITY_DN1090_c0_g1~~TRINITY_DN1090_c0_g1_i3.p1  ORF type:complete len:374 (-),score=67.72 TRINITY_DN1090_c0_g1_i3:33-1154(-)
MKEGTAAVVKPTEEKKEEKEETGEKENKTEEKGGKSEKKGEKDSKKDEGDYYFQSYAHFSIHEEMLKDEVRTGTYRSAIMENAATFKDKIVLDVGCGTGILSMFCAQAGAKHVYAIDCSDIINQARTIVETNGFKDVITLIQGKVEDVDLPVKEVDIIVSEWMGYFLLYENMLDTVICARDKWLAKGGLILPDKANLYFCAIEDAEYKDEKIAWWDNVYGFDMSCIKKVAMREPLIDVVDAQAVVTTSCPVISIDIMTIKSTELSFASNFKITAERNDLVHAFVAYFDVQFNMPNGTVGFSTGPMDHYTHWKSTVFYLEDVLSIYNGEEIDADISCKPNKKNPREMDIVITYRFKGAANHNTQVTRTQKYFLR